MGGAFHGCHSNINAMPILVEAGGMMRDGCAFKIENMWLKVDGFVDKV